MKSILFAAVLLLMVVFTALASTDNTIKGAHLENGLECVDCHNVAEPVKKASAKSCMECHGDMQDAKEIEFKDNSSTAYNLSPHNSHAGVIRCTLCHSSHKDSQLYCNTCHHTFKLLVP